MARAAAIDPDATALVDGDDRLSYQDLMSRIRVAGRQLAATGTGPVAVLLAARRMVMLLDAQQPVERSALILGDAGADLLLCADDATVIPDLALPRITPATLFEASEDPDWSPPAPSAPEEPAVVFFTSGSTGRPKGIVRSIGSLLHRARFALDGMRLGPGDRMLNASQSSTDASFARYLAMLCVGGRIVLYQPAVNGLVALRDRLIAEAVSFVVAGPALMRVALTLPGMQDAFASVRVLTSAGAAMLRADAEAMRAVLPATCELWTTYASAAPASRTASGRTDAACPVA